MSSFSPEILLNLLLLAAPFPWNAKAEAWQVVGGNVSVRLGDTATLPCSLIDAKEPLSQISWQRDTRAKKRTGNFFTILYDKTYIFEESDHRFKFIGNFAGNNGTLQLSNVTLMDEGIYYCIFTLFPSGNYRTEIPLNVLVPPVVSVKDSVPLLGEGEVLLATCTAAASRPPADVQWKTTLLPNKVHSNTTATLHDNGTTTTVSGLYGVPTTDIDQRSVTCSIISAALAEPKSLPFTLQVHYAPRAVNITERAEDSFECVTAANPSASFLWRRPDQSWPLSGVRVEGATLQLVSRTAAANGLYQCDVSNTYGRSHAYLYVHVSSGSCTVCWVLFGLGLVIVLIGLAAAFWYWKFRPSHSTNERSHHEVPQDEEETSHLVLQYKF